MLRRFSPKARPAIGNGRMPLSQNAPPNTPVRGFIRHVVFFSAKDTANIDQIVEGLSMLAKIYHAHLFEVSHNRKVDATSSEVDVIVYGEFANQADLDAYKAHPIYQECIAVVKPLRDLRVAADF
jgi:hypothetical protein